MMSPEEIKKLRRVRSAATALLQELDGLPLDPAPEPQRKRKNLKEGRVDHFALQDALGTWKKPAELKKPKR